VEKRVILKISKADQKAIARNFYKPREPKWDWRGYLTPEEKAVLDAADAAKQEWQRLNKERASITNRAIQRAKYRKPSGTAG
jgi:hypothetical protein